MNPQTSAPCVSTLQRAGRGLTSAKRRANMFRIVAAGSVAAIATLWCVLPAAAQMESQDRCKEVLAEQSFDPPPGENSTFYVLSRHSADTGGQHTSNAP